LHAPRIIVDLHHKSCTAQKKSQDVYVDNGGVMRWGKNKEEVRGFGINYTAMF
jgi:hypothetical protein